MAVTNTTTVSPLYTGNGVTTAFSTVFHFSADSEVLVYLVTISTGVETLQTITTHYTVTGAGTGAAGTVTFVAAPSALYYVKMVRSTALTQLTDYVEGTKFPAATHENSLDKLTRIAQETETKISRAPQLPVSSVNYPLEFPDFSASSGGYLLRINTAGDELELVSSTEAALSATLTPTDNYFIVGDGSDWVTEQPSDARTSLGLDTMATQSAAAVAITGGSITGLTTLSTTDGVTGTGAVVLATSPTLITPVLGAATATSVSSGTLTGTTSITAGGNATSAGQVIIKEDTDNGAHGVTLTVPALAGDYTLTLPVDNGGAGELLSTDGSGTLSWVAAGIATAGGDTTQVQYNNAGTLDGEAGFTFDGVGTATLSVALNVGGNSTAAGKIVFKEDSDNGTNTCTLSGPQSTADVTVTLPATTGTVALTSDVPIASTQADQETSTSTTTYVSPGRQQFHPSSCKAWVKFTSITTTAINASYNITSVTDNGNGDTTITIATDFSGADYAYAGMSHELAASVNNNLSIINGTDPAAGTIRVVSQSNGTHVDMKNCSVVMFGDQ
jgi:hypothetical protein